ncbi:MAG: hypothetical protein IAE80_19435 [Anaerolinea sp.]|nr:hypothetical protein [Anaerolinea sp.]
MHINLQTDFETLLRIGVVLLLIIVIATAVVPLVSPEVQAYLSAETRAAINENRARIAELDREIAAQQVEIDNGERLSMWADRQRRLLTLGVDAVTVGLIFGAAALFSFELYLVKRALSRMLPSLDARIARENDLLALEEIERAASHAQMVAVLQMQRRNRAS